MAYPPDPVELRGLELQYPQTAAEWQREYDRLLTAASHHMYREHMPRLNPWEFSNAVRRGRYLRLWNG